MDVKEFNQETGNQNYRKIGYGFAEYRVLCVNPEEGVVRDETGMFKAKPFGDTDRVIDFLLQDVNTKRETYMAFNIKMERIPDMAWVNGKVEKRAPNDKTEVLIKNELNLQFFLRTICRIKNNSSARFDMKLIFKNDFSEIASALEVCKTNTIWVLTYQMANKKVGEDGSEKTYFMERNLETVYSSPYIEGWEKRMSNLANFSKKPIEYKIVPYVEGNLFKPATGNTAAPAKTATPDIPAQTGDDDMPF